MGENYKLRSVGGEGWWHMFGSMFVSHTHLACYLFHFALKFSFPIWELCWHYVEGQVLWFAGVPLVTLGR